MDTDYSILRDHGFALTWTHTKMNQLLKEADYVSLQQCDNLEDVIVKLCSSPYAPFLTSELIKSTKIFNKKLSKFLLGEFNELMKISSADLKLVLEYFRNTFRISNFVYLLAVKDEEFSLQKAFENIDAIGDFTELCALKVAADMSDVFKYVVENTFLEKYYSRITFNNEIRANDFQVVNSLLKKFLVEDFYDQIVDKSGMSKIINILKTEGDRRIIEITINTLDSIEIVGKKRINLFPKVCSLDIGIIQRLGSCSGMDDLRGILAAHHVYREIVSADDITHVLMKIESRKYSETFGFFNDPSCVYSYLRMREQEIKNINWVVECMLFKKQDGTKNIILPDCGN